MIALGSDCLLFQMTSGESVPFSAEMISVELMGDTAKELDAEFLRHATHAVFHYFKHELGRQSVSLGEFAGAMEKVLRGLDLKAQAAEQATTRPGLMESDLRALADEASEGGELFFFPRLRDELRHHLAREPLMLRFRGLRACVKQLVGVRRWTSGCQRLEDQIVAYLRECSKAEAGPN